MSVFAVFRLLVVADFLWSLYWLLASMASPAEGAAPIYLDRAPGHHIVSFDSTPPSELIAEGITLLGPLIAYFVSLVLLLRFAPAGRYLYLMVLAFCIGLGTTNGDTVYRPFESILATLTDVMVGALIAFMFTGAVGERFSRQRTTAAASTPSVGPAS